MTVQLRAAPLPTLGQARLRAEGPRPFSHGPRLGHAGDRVVPRWLVRFSRYSQGYRWGVIQHKLRPYMVTKPPPKPRKVNAGDTREEMKVYGLNACLAIAAVRREDIVRILLLKSLQREFSETLAWCAKERRAYRFVEPAELAKVSGAQHHEGVVMVVRIRRQPTLDEILTDNSARTILFLDGVGNPHNLGAILRSAAHFGVSAVIVPRMGGANLSGAALRVAEGGAEHVPVLVVGDPLRALRECKQAGFKLVAADGRGRALFSDRTLAERSVLLFGAEGQGLSRAVSLLADQTLAIPGSGLVESLNVATAVAVFLAEIWRQQR